MSGTALLYLTRLTPSVVAAVVQELIRHPASTTVMVPSGEMAVALEQHGIQASVLALPPERDWEKRDNEFRRLALPGTLEGLVFPGADLPVYRVISLDRLYFFFQPQMEQELEMLAGMDIGQAVVTLDLTHPMPFAIARMCRERGVRCVGLEAEYTESVEYGLAREAGWLDMFTEIVSAPPEAAVPVTEEQRQRMRAGMGLSDSEQVDFVAFDLREEHRLRRFIEQVPPARRLLVWPVDERAKEKLWALYGEWIRNGRIAVAGLEHQAAADRFVVFRRAEYLRKARVPLQIQDDRFLSNPWSGGL